MPSPPAVPTRSLPRATPSYARTAMSVLLVAVLYLWVFPYHQNINNPNENVRVYMTVSIVDDHTFAINRIERDWGYTNDKAARNGKLYSSKAPGTSYLGVPAYWLLTHLTHRDSQPVTPAQIRAHHKPPLDREMVIYILRLFANVVPGIVFAWFWHRFLGRHTRHPALREAVFFSTMIGSLLFAYCEMYASHSVNAFCAMGAMMAIATARERDVAAVEAGARTPLSLGPYFVAGLLGAAATMFEYPAALATIIIALLILATASVRWPWFSVLALGFMGSAVRLFLHGHKAAAAVFALLGAASYAMTLDVRALPKLAFAALGSVPATFLTLFYHKRCFGDPFKPGYSYLENPTFHAETSQGFFGATAYSWEAGIRLWLDPAFGLVPMTAILLASILGFGVYLSWRPPKRAVWPVRGVILLFTLFCAWKSYAAFGAIKAANWTGAASHQASYVAYFVIALVALASVTLENRRRVDPAIGASILIISIAMSQLIGMMNNWRGGWEVGPRYLATIVPMLGLVALVGLDAISELGSAYRRGATIFAAAATLHAMLMSGIPSAFFPHIPTEFVSPFFELFMPVVRDGYVPHNAGQYLFHSTGLRSMAPFFVAAIVVAVIVARGDERRPLMIAAHAMGAFGLMFVLLAPFGAVAKYENMPVTRFVKSVWEPRPPEDRPPPPPMSPTAALHGRIPVPPPEPPDALRNRARHLAESGDTNAAWDAYRRAANGGR